MSLSHQVAIASKDAIFELIKNQPGERAIAKQIYDCLANAAGAGVAFAGIAFSCFSLHPFLEEKGLQIKSIPDTIDSLLVWINQMGLERINLGEASYSMRYEAEQKSFWSHDETLRKKLGMVLGIWVRTTPVKHCPIQSYVDFVIHIGQVDEESVFTIRAQGDGDVCTDLSKWVVSKSITADTETPEADLVTGFSPNKNQSPRFTRRITRLKTETVIPEMYPWIKKHPMVAMDDFFRAKGSILVLHGEAGSGKSTLAAAAAKAWRGPVLHIQKTDIVLSPEFGQALSSAVYESVSKKHPRCLVIIEEADAILTKRENGNLLMHEFLNMTSGMAQLPAKFIMLANLTNFKNVDPAVLRENRLFAAVHFRALTSQEALLLREALGVHREWKNQIVPGRLYTLADVVCQDDTSAFETSATPKTIGLT